MKIKWKVAEAPTGRYRSFQKRGWPSAYYEGGEPAASISCEDDYVPRDVKDGKHAPLTLRIADHSKTPWKWVRAKHTCATLQEAKDLFVRLVEKYPHIVPVKKDEIV